MQFFFAWVNKKETFDPKNHTVFDENILSFEIRHQEGNFPALYVELQNKKDLFKNKTEDGRIFLSCRSQGLAASPVLLFDGVLQKDPSFLDTDTVSCVFSPKTPERLLEFETALETLKQPPFWNPLFVPWGGEKAPREILDGGSLLPHWSRTSGDLSWSDYLKGQERVMNTAIFREGLALRFVKQPLDVIDVEIKVEWCQFYRGIHNLTDVILENCPQHLLETLTPQDFETKWWKAPFVIQGTPYEVLESELIPVRETNIPGSPFGQKTYDPHLVVGWTYKQKREETCHFRLRNSLTPLLEDKPPVSADRSYHLRFHLNDVTVDDQTPHFTPHTFYKKDAVIQYGASPYKALRDHTSSSTFSKDSTLWEPLPSPFLNPSSSSFFCTNRGHDAITHALEVAATYLKASSRAYVLEFDLPFEDALGLSCDQSLAIHSPQFPKGTLTGKVLRYHLKARGPTLEASVTLGVSLFDPPKDRSCPEGYTPSPSNIFFRLCEDPFPKTGLVAPEKITARDLVQAVTLTNPADQQLRLPADDVPNHPTALKIDLMDLITTDVLPHSIVLDVKDWRD